MGREGLKRPLLLQDGRVQEAEIYSETRKGLDAKFTSNQEEVISSALDKCSQCHSYKSGVVQGFQQALGGPVTDFDRALEEKMCWGGGGEILHTMMGPFFLRN